MKNRFYLLIVGLLMTVCGTASGQEVTSEFTHSNGLKNIGCHKRWNAFSQKDPKRIK